MKKKQYLGVRLFSVCALCASLVLLALFPSVQRLLSCERTPQRAQRQLVTVWIHGDRLSASPWVRQQTAAWQKQTDAVSVWVRTVTRADIALLAEDYAHAAPDMLLFMAGEEIPFGQTQRVQPLCMAGYALVGQAKTQRTPVPTSLFGVTPAPSGEVAATPAPRESWPRALAADDALGAYFLQQMGAPGGALLLPEEEAASAFLQRRVDAALLSTLQIRNLLAQGAGVELLCAAPGSDLILFGALMQDAQPAAAELMQYLLSDVAQRALAEKGLFSAAGVHLYGADTPVLQAVEAALEDGWLPEPLIWPQEKMEKVHLGQLLYAAQ